MWKNSRPKWVWKSKVERPRLETATIQFVREEYNMVPLKASVIVDPRFDEIEGYDKYMVRPQIEQKILSGITDNHLLSITRNVDEYNHSIVYTGTIYVGRKKYDTMSDMR